MREYGGYLPIELNEGKEYYDFSAQDMLRVNCGRSAILCAIEDGRYSKVYIPLYTCQSVSEALEKHGISYEYYHIDMDFNPVDVVLENEQLLLWTNYYGIIAQNQTDAIVGRYKNVLLDNTQAFFSKPVMHAYNAYSCRKFFGVGDGAYLIHEGMRPVELNRDSSAQTSQFLLEAVEKGTNAAYQQSLDNEARIAESGILGMSSLTQKILQSVDYEHVIRMRKENFQYLHEKLGHLNQLSFSLSDEVPMVYPFLFLDDNLRSYLVGRKIYVPQWWKWVAEMAEANEFEKTLSNYLFALPIDQRYGEEDMEYISKLILDYICDREV